MTEPIEGEAPRAKLSPPAEHEAGPIPDLRLPAFGDAEAWSRVRLGLLLQLIANSIIAVAIAIAFIFDHCFRAVGGDGHLHVSLLLMSSRTIAFTVIVLFSWWLMFIAGILCRQVPHGQAGRGMMTLCLSCHLAWFILLDVKAYLEYVHHVPFEWEPWPATPAWQVTLHASLTFGIITASVVAMISSTAYLSGLFQVFGLARARQGCWVSLVFLCATFSGQFLPTFDNGLTQVLLTAVFLLAIAFRSILLLNLRRAILLGNRIENHPSSPSFPLPPAIE